jgi:CRISPR/Cas system CSM-associated protein Csm3 (group 7 of RAMP superfamily)
MSIHAPYNFVPLNKYVFIPWWGNKISQDLPFSDGEDGVIKISFTNLTPISFGGNQIGDKDSYKTVELSSVDIDGTKHYYIPGTSIKGMIRNVLEIMTFSRLSQFNNDKLSYSDSFLSEKEDKVNWKESDNMKTSQCGYLFIKDNNIWLHSDGNINLHDIGNLKTKITEFANQLAIDPILACLDQAKEGPIKQLHTGDIEIINEDKEVVLSPVEFARRIICTIEEHLRANKRKQQATTRLTIKQLKYLINNPSKRIPLFSKQVKEITKLSLSCKCRYFYANDVRKGIVQEDKTISDELRTNSTLDMAECIFGFVKEDTLGTLKGRVSFGNAFLNRRQNNNITNEELILGQPKATYYPLYIKQKNNRYSTYEADNFVIAGRKRYCIHNEGYFTPVKGDILAQMSIDDLSKLLIQIDSVQQSNSHNQISDLERSLDQKFGDTIGRDRQGYPGRHELSAWKKLLAQNLKIVSKLQLLPCNNTFKCDIRFHNLRPEEIGALISAITFNGNMNAYHNVGMGKSVGYGKIRIDSLELNESGKEKEQSPYLLKFNALMTLFTRNYGIGNYWQHTSQIESLLKFATTHNNNNIDLSTMILDEYSDYKRPGKEAFIVDNTHYDNKDYTIENNVSELSYELIELTHPIIGQVKRQWVKANDFMEKEDYQSALLQYDNAIGNYKAENVTVPNQLNEQRVGCLKKIAETLWEKAKKLMEQNDYPAALSQFDDSINYYRNNEIIPIPDKLWEERQECARIVARLERADRGLAVLNDLYELGDNKGNFKTVNFNVLAKTVNKWLIASNNTTVPLEQQEDLITAIQRIRKNDLGNSKTKIPWEHFDSNYWLSIIKWIREEKAKQLFNDTL